MPYITVYNSVRLRSVALVTRDPSLYHAMAGFLRERGWPSESLLPGTRIPDHVAVVLTSADEAVHIDHPRVLAVHEDADLRTLAAAVTHALLPGEKDAEIVVGIDPGPCPGYAILAGTFCLGEGNLDNPAALGPFAAQLHHRFPSRAVRFRVGSGAPRERNQIVNVLLDHRRAVEVVDEGGSTPRGRRRPRDAVAARTIARSAGRAIRAPLPVTYTPGEVANLQRLSREGSGGRVTISRSSAHRVLTGELTLAQAVDEAVARNRGPSHARDRPPTRERL